MNRAVALRIAACGLMGLGAALLIAALLLSTYTEGKIAKVPLDIDTTLVSDGTGTVFDPASLNEPKFVVDRNAPVSLQQQISVEAPSDADVVTLQVGNTLRRTDRQKDNGLLLALVDTVTLDRKTALAVSTDTNPGGAVQKPRSIDDDNPPTNVALPHEGLTYRFPFDTEKKTYPFFDPIAQKAYDANYDGEEDLNGLTTFRFTQNVGYDSEGKLSEPVKYASLYGDEADSVVSARAELWGLPGEPEEQITMTRYYAAERTFWVDPVSGTIVKAKEHGYHYYAREALRPEVPFADYTVTSTEQTVESQVASARDEGDVVALWGRILPITFTAIGLVALVGGVLLGSFTLRAESALIDPGLDDTGHGFFGRRPTDTGPMPAAEAATEKIPTQRPSDLLRTDRSDRPVVCSNPGSLRSCPPGAVPAYALALSLVVTAPLLAPGYLLLRDAVSTPRSYLTDAALGLSEAAPRALPQDFAVALASHVVDGGLVVKALVIAALWCAGWGAARLAAIAVPAAGLPGQFVAATLAVWNPYVAERLLQGHWSLLVGYGCLPWVAVSVLRLRSGAGDGDGTWWPVLFWIALAGLTPTGLMLAATVALVTCAAPGSGRSRWACGAVSLGTAVLVALPWLVASLVGGSLTSSQVAGVPEFAARAEPGLGTLGSLAGLGGIWNGQAVPDSRTTAFAVVATLVLLVIVAVGLPTVLRRPAAVPLLILAAVAVVVPALMATTPGLTAVEIITRAVPGLGVVRDAQKWVALALPAYAVAGAAAVVTLQGRIPRVVAAAVCCLALLAVLPDLTWGVGGRVTSVRYPPGWTAAAALINADPRPVAVLPQMSMRRFPWAGDVPVLDPLPRWVSADVLTTGDLVIGGRTVPGEGGRAREVERLVLAGAGVDELTTAGVGWVVDESGGTPRLQLPVAYADDDLVVYRVGGDRPAAAHRGVMIAAHLGWLTTLLVGAVGMGFTAVARRRRRH